MTPNKNVAFIIQIITVVLLATAQLDMFLKVALVFGYIILFQQERWHKHLYIMLVMVLLLFVVTFLQQPKVYSV